MNDLSRKSNCPTVPNPYRGTVGQLTERGTVGGTPRGTRSLKAIADKVLSKPKAGQTVGQSVGQIENCCPTTPGTVGQQKPTVPRLESGENAPPASTPDPGTRPVDDPWYDNMISMVIEDLNDCGIEVMAVPAEARQKARKLEQEFSEAAAADDMPRFWKALREWQRTWKGSLH